MAIATYCRYNRGRSAGHTQIICGRRRIGEHPVYRLSRLPEQTVVNLRTIFERIHNVGNNSTGRGQLTCTLAVEHHVSQHVAFDHDSVEHVIHTGKLVCFRYKAWLHTGCNAAVFSAFHPSNQLNNTVQLLCSCNIGHSDVTDASCWDVLRVDVMAADQR